MTKDDSLIFLGHPACTKYYENWLIVDEVIAIMKRVPLNE